MSSMPGQLQTKVQAVVKALKVPVEVYLACHDDYYRKVSITLQVWLLRTV